MIIAIDGTSGSGKSTLAKSLANKLHYGFFSAGALYRALAAKALSLSISENDEEALKQLTESTEVLYTYNQNSNIMIVDGVNITDRLYTEETTNFTPKIACKPYIREFVRQLQQDTKNNNENIVMEGRDIGSVIFPDADLKIYVDCKAEIRAERRMKDYEKLGDHASLSQVISEIEDRDYQDIHRPISPLIMCENALLIDTSYTSTEECLTIIFKEMLRRGIVSKEFFETKGITV